MEPIITDPIKPHQKPSQKAGFRLEAMDGEMLLYHPSDARIFYFNPSASLVWELCDGSRSSQEIIDMLVEAYPEDSEEITADVTATLQQFAALGCVDLR